MNPGARDFWWWATLTSRAKNCHCERSEAIASFTLRLLRFARNDMSLIRKIRYHTDNGKSLRSQGGGLRLCEPDPPYAPYAGIYRNPYQLAWDTTRFLPSFGMTASFVIPNEGRNLALF